NDGTIAVGVNTVTAGSITGGGEVTISTGTINAGGTSTITTLTVSGGPAILNSTGTVLTIADDPDGAIQTSGTVTLNGTAFTSITNSGDLTISNPVTLSGNWTDTGTFNAGGNAVTFDPPPAGTSTISGNTTFANLSCTNQGGATLTIDGTITVTGTLTLTGTNAGSLLTVNGGGSIALPGAQYTGHYLFVDTVPIASGTYTAYNSTSAATPSGWYLPENGPGFPVWTGAVNGDWHEPGNWDTGAVPVATDEVEIRASGNDPTLGAPGATVFSCTITSGTLTLADSFVTTGNLVIAGAGEIDCAGQSLTVGGAITNNGTVRLTGAETLGIPLPANAATSTVIYEGGGTPNPIWGAAYGNLTVDTSTTLLLGTTAVTVAGTLENLGVIEKNDTGSIDVSDNNSGIFRYSTGGGTIPALLGYNDLEITDGTWSATDALTVGGALTVNGTANASFNAGAGGQATRTGTASFTTSGTISFGNDTSDSFTVTGGALAISGTPAFALAGTLDATGITLGKDAGLAAPTAFASTVTVSANSIVTTNAHALTFNANFSCTTNNLETAGTGTVTIADGVALTSTNGNLTFGGAVSLAGAASSISTTDGAITFSGTVTNAGFITGGTALLSFANTVTNNNTITAGSGDINFGNTVTNSGTIAVGGNAITATGGAGITGGTVTISDTGSIDARGTITTLTVSDAADTITIDGDTGFVITNPVRGNLTTSGTITLNSTAATPITSLSNSGLINLNGDLNITGNISTSGSLTVIDGQSLVQGAAATFTVSAGTVSIGNGTCTIGNLDVTGGSFTQTGINAGTQSATSLVTGVAGIIRWDFGSNGGTLTLAGNVTPSGGAISFGHKDVTFTANATIADGTFYSVTVANPATVTGQGVFYDLTIANGGTFVANGNVRIMWHLDINGGGIYTNGGQTLTFGGAGSVDGGTITDSNAAGSKQNLGAVIIDAAGQTKNAGGGGILMTSMAVTAGTFAAGANTVDITGNLSGTGTFTGGTAAIDIDGDVTVANFTA
ncbi:MAG TPA: hypothetical protein PKW16_02420, partial [Treponemataceae bacterium]|nr:hypothetical protein [Treponemataceae bacterium]